MLMIFAIIPAVLFPQFKDIEPTGSYPVATENYTLTDINRIEKYSDRGDNRKVTIQFWYPETEIVNEKYPLVIFSHGAF